MTADNMNRQQLIGMAQGTMPIGYRTNAEGGKIRFHAGGNIWVVTASEAVAELLDELWGQQKHKADAGRK